MTPFASLDALRAAADQDGAEQPGLAALARNMAMALGAYRSAVEYMLGQAQAPRAAFLGSVPYLMLSGVVLAGWQASDLASPMLTRRTTSLSASIKRAPASMPPLIPKQRIDAGVPRM